GCGGWCSVVRKRWEGVEKPEEAEAVTNKLTGPGVLPECRDRRNAVLAQCLRDGRAVAEKHRARRQNERLPAGIVHGAKCAGVAALAFDFDHARLQPQLAGGLGRSIALLARNRVECDSDDGPARERLARDLDAFGGELELADENTGHVAPGA